MQLSRTLVVALAVLAGGCSNHEFRRDPDGRVVVDGLVDALRSASADGATKLQEDFWIPLLYRRVTRFLPTEEPGFPEGGYTLSQRCGVGPFTIFWFSEDVGRHDAAGVPYHRRDHWRAVARLVSQETIRWQSSDGEYHCRRGALFFGLLQDRAEDVPGPPRDAAAIQATAAGPLSASAGSTSCNRGEPTAR